MHNLITQVYMCNVQYSRLLNLICLLQTIWVFVGLWLFTNENVHGVVISKLMLHLLAACYSLMTKG